ncbi:MAG TPA: nuclear transport factor 2 family protein [Actinomycetes bacterium]
MSTAASAVEAANTALYTAFETGDLDLMGSLWTDAAEGPAHCVHPGWSPLTGRSEILRSWALIMASTAYVQFIITDVETVLLGDVAVVTCTENSLSGSEDGSTLAGGHTVATNVFLLRDGVWRIWLHHASPVLGQLADGKPDDDREGQ